MSSPLIGLTMHSTADADRAELDLLLGYIVQAVERAGGLPLLIPPGLSAETLRGLYARLDGVLFSGGGDVAPARYGAEMHPKVGGVDDERDRVELTLARWVVADAKPFFGICRGAQVVNVALGGTLYRDVSEHPGAHPHTYYPNFPRDLRAHAVKVEEDSLLARVLGEPLLAVNSLHHQACQDIAPDLLAAARAPDGLVEAVEAPNHPFGLAVQWHPECFPEAPEMRRLFEAFVAAAGDALTCVTTNAPGDALAASLQTRGRTGGVATNARTHWRASLQTRGRTGGVATNARTHWRASLQTRGRTGGVTTNARTHWRASLQTRGRTGVRHYKRADVLAASLQTRGRTGGVTTNARTHWRRRYKRADALACATTNARGTKA